MKRIYALLQIGLLLVAALVVLGLGFSAVSAMKGKCILIASTLACQILNICLSALLFFAVAYCTMFWINKVRKNSGGQ